MKLYRTDTGRWASNERDARRLARADNTRFGAVDVPTDKAGLLAWLNAQPLPGASREPAGESLVGTPPSEQLPPDPFVAPGPPVEFLEDRTVAPASDALGTEPQP
jgi:hypothetical protein